MSQFVHDGDGERESKAEARRLGQLGITRADAAEHAAVEKLHGGRADPAALPPHPAAPNDADAPREEAPPADSKAEGGAHAEDADAEPEGVRPGRCAKCSGADERCIRCLKKAVVADERDGGPLSDALVAEWSDRVIATKPSALVKYKFREWWGGRALREDAAERVRAAYEAAAQRAAARAEEGEPEVKRETSKKVSKSAGGIKSPRKAAARSPAKHVAVETPAQRASAVAERPRAPASAPTVPKAPRSSAAGLAAAAEAAPGTEQGRSRPRRGAAAAAAERIASTLFADGGDGHVLVDVAKYTPADAPFVLEVSPAADALMDCHAHLSPKEIIGLLGGTIAAPAGADADSPPGPVVLRVLRAFPVKEVVGAALGATGDIDVEMDSVDELRVRAEIQAAGMQVVGWYHSHPDFDAQPSVIDVSNQLRHQHYQGRGNLAALNEARAAAALPEVAVRGPHSAGELYAAAIVSPFGAEVKGDLRTSIRWFHVQHGKAGSAHVEAANPMELGCAPRELRPTVAPFEPGSFDGAQDSAVALAQEYKERRECLAHMLGPWRGLRQRLGKLERSLGAQAQAWGRAWGDGDAQEAQEAQFCAAELARAVAFQVDDSAAFGDCDQ
ncbi:unnamed protein product [Pedinophyceae sp. YPF-701]|nr:unnamed protein product [Pedinophyceae sp. YPF-701]